MKWNLDSQNICASKINLTCFLNGSTKFNLLENENYEKNIDGNFCTYNSLFLLC